MRNVNFSVQWAWLVVKVGVTKNLNTLHAIAITLLLPYQTCHSSYTPVLYYIAYMSSALWSITYVKSR